MPGAAWPGALRRSLPPRRKCGRTAHAPPAGARLAPGEHRPPAGTPPRGTPVRPLARREYAHASWPAFPFIRRTSVARDNDKGREHFPVLILAYLDHLHRADDLSVL